MSAKNAKRVSRLNQDFLTLRLHEVNKILSRLEGEIETLFKKLVQQGEKSSRELRKNFDDILGRFKKNDFYNKAQAKRGDFEKEIRRLADDIVSKVKGLEIKPSRFTASRLVKDSQKSLNHFVQTLEKTDIIAMAKTKAENTRTEILSVLKIPSQNDVGRLEKRISSLEKRLQLLNQKAA